MNPKGVSMRFYRSLSILCLVCDSFMVSFCEKRTTAVSTRSPSAVEPQMTLLWRQ